MSWRRWKWGLVVAVVSALCDGIVILLVDPNVALRALAIGLMVMLAKALGLYLKQHPIEEISSETIFIQKGVEGAGKTNAERTDK